MPTLLIALIALALGVIITYVVCYFIPREKVRKQNEEIFNEEQRTQERINKLVLDYQQKNELLQSSTIDKLQFNSDLVSLPSNP